MNFLLFQPAAGPSNLASILIVVALVIGGFLAGVLVTILFFRIKRRKQVSDPTLLRPLVNTESNRVNIKHCSLCDSTYTDEELSYCLRDGTLLKIVGSMPAPPDPDETRVINRNR